MGGALAQIITVFSMIIGVAIISVLVSKNSNTQGVITSTFSGFSQALGVAESPVTSASSGASSLFGGSLNF